MCTQDVGHPRQTKAELAPVTVLKSSLNQDNKTIPTRTNTTNYRSWEILDLRGRVKDGTRADLPIRRTLTRGGHHTVAARWIHFLMSNSGLRASDLGFYSSANHDQTQDLRAFQGLSIFRISRPKYFSSVTFYSFF